MSRFSIDIIKMPDSCRVCPFHETDFSEEHICRLIKFIKKYSTGYEISPIIGYSVDTPFLHKKRIPICPLDNM